MLVFDAPWVLTNPSVAETRERAISLMKWMCHVSQSYYSRRKTDCLNYLLHKTLKKKNKRGVLFSFFFAAWEKRVRHDLNGKKRGDGVERGAPKSQTEAIKHRWKFLAGDDLYDSHCERAL